MFNFPIFEHIINTNIITNSNLSTNLIHGSEISKTTPPLKTFFSKSKQYVVNSPTLHQPFPSGPTAR